MDAKTIVKSTQEQAVASWVNYLNQLRLDRLTEILAQQKDNLGNAMEQVTAAFDNIAALIETNRGGAKGLHGFIAEAAEVGFGNARRQILGESANYTWVDDNGAVDLLRGSLKLQLKFTNDNLSLRAVAAHLEKYPDFIKNGGRYQIPKDQYETIKYYLSISKEAANKMPTSDGTFSLKQWKMVNDFFNNGQISPDDIEPSIFNYKDVQVGQIDRTLQHEKQVIKLTDKRIRDDAYQESLPTIQEGLKATAVSAAVEGCMELCLGIIKKRREGKAFCDFNESDWKELGWHTIEGSGKGAIRGISIYALTNYTATPASVANAIVTASFGVAQQAHLYRSGELTDTEFIENAEAVCLDAAVSALSSFIGQALIPAPVIGAVIGNATGTILYKIAKDSLSEREQTLIRNYLNSISLFEDELNNKYSSLITSLSKSMDTFMEILESIYSPNIDEMFKGSIAMAKFIGVPEAEILDTPAKVASYFTE